MADKTKVKKRREIKVAKECLFCKEDKLPVYSDISTLQKFVTERGKIMSRSRNGVCAKHQRKLTMAIKYARHLALLPFSGVV